MERFVYIRRVDFERFIYQYGECIYVKVGGEMCYDMFIDRGRDIRLRIYSSVDKNTGMSRPKGEDCIKLVLMRGDYFYWTTMRKVYRVEGWRGQLGSLIQRYFGLWTKLICRRCGRMLVERVSGYGKFYSCEGYPLCKEKLSLWALDGL